MINEDFIKKIIEQNELNASNESLYSKIEEALLYSKQLVFQNNINSSISLLKKLIKIIERSKINEKNYFFSKIFFELGNIYRDFINIKYALKYYQIALYYNLNDTFLKSKILFSIGACFEMQNDLANAMKFYEDSYILIKEDKYLNNLKSSIITRIGCVLTKNNDFKIAEKKFNEALIIRDNDIIFNDTSYIENKIAILDLKKGKVDNAFEKVKRNITKKNNSKLFEAQTLILLTDISFFSHEINIALNYSSQAEKICNENSFNHQLKSLINIFNNYAIKQ